MDTPTLTHPHTHPHTHETEAEGDFPWIQQFKRFFSLPAIWKLFSFLLLSERTSGSLNGRDSRSHTNRSSEASIFCGSQMRQLD